MRAEQTLHRRMMNTPTPEVGEVRLEHANNTFTYVYVGDTIVAKIAVRGETITVDVLEQYQR